MISKLQVWSYIEIIAIGFFIFLGFSGFSLFAIMKKHIWVGMARETAHQLSTPVSALLGWVQLIKDHPDKFDEIIPEMEIDLQRLEQINRRFGEMGSESEFEEFDLSIRIEKIIKYLSKRLPSLGQTVKLENDIQPGIIMRANGSLLAWSIENVQNSIDSIDQRRGEISISLEKKMKLKLE